MVALMFVQTEICRVFKGKDMRRLLMFELCYLLSTDEVWWEKVLNDSNVRCKVLGLEVQSLQQALNQNSL